MQEEEIIKRIEAQGKRIDEVYVSIEKIRKYFLWNTIINISMIVLPLGAILAIIPWFLSKISSLYGGI